MPIIVLAHNIRSTYNIGAILRSCDGFGVDQFWATGYTPYPTINNDERPPHVRAKLTRQIAKTALGAETSVKVMFRSDAHAVIENYRHQGYSIAALEQTANSIALPAYKPPERLLLVLGEEVHGIAPQLLNLCDVTLEIPMKGTKESFNVSVAAGIALYALSTA